MLWFYLEAPFAACRTFTAGWYRPTATFLTPSAAYGLLLNVAQIETRLREGEEGHDGKTPATLVRRGLPAAKIAIGLPADGAFPRIASVFQQLHNYPVGVSGAERAESCFGNKYNITPVRRELLLDVRAIVVVDAEQELERRIRQGLQGELNDGRYGLPFLGDNQFLLDKLQELREPRPAYWYEQIREQTGGAPRPRTTRLTILIDRADLSRTTSALYAPASQPDVTIPTSAWTEISPPPAGPAPATPRRRSRKA